jgi:hypothetical protein
LVYQDREACIRDEDRSMAVDTTGGHPAMDYAEHLRTYSGFILLSLVP